MTLLYILYFCIGKFMIILYFSIGKYLEMMHTIQLFLLIIL